MIGLESYLDICNIFQGIIIFVLFTKNVKKKKERKTTTFCCIL